MKRWIVLLTAAVIAAIAWAFAPRARADGLTPKAPSGAVKVEFSSEGLSPREIEDTTEVAIPRDYATAWNALETALSQNRAAVLDNGFVGFARDRFAQRVADQKKSGMHVRYLDRGHKLQAIFYSPEGSTMQLRDTAQYELEVLDGDTVISSQPVTQNYIALMTVTEDRWKVRVLESVP
jgi:hypothetical protein